MIFASENPETPELVTLSWRNRVNVGLVFTMLILLPIFSHAGGLGISGLVFLLGIGGILTATPKMSLSIPRWLWVLLALLVWANVTAFWSPYESKNVLTNAMKLGIGAPLMLGCVLSFKSAAAMSREMLTHLLLAVMVFAAGLLIIDILSGYALTFLVDPPKDGENIIRKGGDAEMNLGHAITILVILMPGIMMMIRRTLRTGWVLALLFAALVLAAAYFGQLTVGIIAALAALIAMYAARIDGHRTIKVLTWLAVFSILAAPFFGYLLSNVSPELKARLPFSWEHRVEMWGYTAHRILDAPIWGHGFDAVRTFEATFSSRGVENWAVVSLHPHNAGLHIWAETGIVGAALAAITIMMVGMAAEKFSEGSKDRAAAAAGLFAAATVICGITYGVWQDWWWASLILAAATLILIPRKRPDQT